MQFRFFIKNNEIQGYAPIEYANIFSIEHDFYLDKNFKEEGYFVYKNGDIIIGELPEYKGIL